MNEETLLLYYYGELDDAARFDVERAMERDVSLRKRFDALCEDLDRLAAPRETELPAGTAGRWHALIESAAAGEARREPAPARGFHLPSFAWGTALAATLIVGIAIGVGWHAAREPVVVETIATAAPAASSATPFERGLALYLQTSRHRIADLPIDADVERGRLISELVRQNRLYEKAATKNGAHDLARLLRAFEPVLLRMAAEDVPAGDLSALREQLAFELDATLTRLGRGASEKPVMFPDRISL